jgi:acyl-CoA dehydrogenase
VIRNFQVRPVAWLLRALVFPFGRREVPPSDRLGHRVAALLMSPNEARSRLLEWSFMSPTANNPVGRMNALLADVIAAEPIERKFLKAVKAGQITAYEYADQLLEAEKAGAISESERKLLEKINEATAEFINVDDFDPSELVAAKVREGKSGKTGKGGKRAA